ncbi:hypothetical protein N7493_001774 [Penicillium malachiteum]|uniref:Aminoglycoside phosphotransferase domain-containing protein n=1 Tax=Penicillium malachiteum TaxID=1324776 RepID=A0AAD6MZZ6_9EURO|nr:hypothetical protein N7493_001774 [Penicillium malachiteum]
MSKVFEVGMSHMLRDVHFNDGKALTVRLRMPELSFMNGPPDMKMEFRSEVACMKLFKARTSIPVPEVYHFEPEPHDIGAPYVIIEHLPGKHAYDMHNPAHDPLDGFGTPEQDRKFRRQLAAIQVEMTSLKFDKIGSLYQNPETEEFSIGPDCKTGKGPWKSSLEYYHHLVNRRLEECLRDAPEATKDDLSFSLPILFERLIAMYVDEASISGPFGLTHFEFGPPNLIVNEQFDCLTFLDFRGLFSGPIEVQALCPYFTGLDIVPPFHVKTRPSEIKRKKAGKRRLEEYKRLVQEHERKMQAGGPPIKAEQRLSEMLFSEASAIVTGLQCYRKHEDLIHETLMLSFSRLLRRKLKESIEEKNLK